MTTNRTPLVMLAVTALLVGACSSSGGGGTPHTTLAQALQQVRVGDSQSFEVDFGRPSAARSAAGGADATTSPYFRATGFGLGQLGDVAQIVEEKLGVDLLAADYAVSAGSPPDTGTLVSGLELGGLGPKLTGLGANASGSRGSVTYRFRPDHDISTSDRLATAFPGVINDLNVVSTDGSDLRYGSGTKAIAATAGGDGNLFDDPDGAAIASCLDDPLAAIIVSTLPHSPVSGRVPAAPSSLIPTPTAGVVLTAAGLSGSKGATPTEQLCVRADSDAHAKTIGSAIDTALRSGLSATLNKKWSRVLTDPKVDVDGSTVRVTAHPVGGAGGVLLSALERGDLPGVSG